MYAPGPGRYALRDYYSLLLYDRALGNKKSGQFLLHRPGDYEEGGRPLPDPEAQEREECASSTSRRMPLCQITAATAAGADATGPAALVYFDVASASYLAASMKTRKGMGMDVLPDDYLNQEEKALYFRHSVPLAFAKPSELLFSSRAVVLCKQVKDEDGFKFWHPLNLPPPPYTRLLQLPAFPFKCLETALQKLTTRLDAYSPGTFHGSRPNRGPMTAVLEIAPYLWRTEEQECRKGPLRCLQCRTYAIWRASPNYRDMAAATQGIKGQIPALRRDLQRTERGRTYLGKLGSKRSAVASKETTHLQ